MRKAITLIVFIYGVFTGMVFAQDEAWQEDIRNRANSVLDGGTAVTSAEEVEGVTDGSGTADADSITEEETVHADESQTKPPKKKNKLVFPYRRFVEFGLTGSVGLSNNFVGLSDILRKNIELNMNELSDRIKEDGWNIGGNVYSDVFFNFNISPRWGFGIFVSVSGDINATLSKSLMTLIAEGNTKSPSQSGSISVSGGVFADTGLDMHGRFLKDDKLKVTLAPSLFIPVVYIPKSTISYQLNAEDVLSITAGGKINIFTPVFTKSIIEDSSFGSDIFNINNIIGQKGFDFTLTAEYNLFPWLNVGGGFTHIPLSPAVLENRASVLVPNQTLVDGSGLIEGKTDDLIKTPDYEIIYDKSSIEIIRPMRFDVYADYKPFKSNLLIIRPNVGFTVFTPEDEARFNAVVGVQLNTPILLIHASTGYNELLWQHKLWLGLNLRIIEADLGLHLSSQDFKQSFDMRGAGVTLGVRLGF
ncbi:MAG: hypothetical protein LBG05_10520 [Treponema sp.]|jgi:hypothetical protein|nr:hypothetical protein [Treponema sp.]